MVSNPIEDEPSFSDNFGRRDRELIYRALLELSNDIGDVKQMMASLVYSGFQNRSSNFPALPSSSSIPQQETVSSQIIKYNPDIDTPLGMRSMPEPEIEESTDIYEEKNAIESFFNAEEIPSIEETEQFLIKRALEKFDGNRRKASETLGISERTLYRKLDQYGLA